GGGAGQRARARPARAEPQPRGRQQRRAIAEPATAAGHARPAEPAERLLTAETTGLPRPRDPVSRISPRLRPHRGPSTNVLGGRREFSTGRGSALPVSTEKWLRYCSLGVRTNEDLQPYRTVGNKVHGGNRTATQQRQESRRARQNGFPGTNPAYWRRLAWRTSRKTEPQ